MSLLLTDGIAEDDNANKNPGIPEEFFSNDRTREDFIKDHFNLVIVGILNKNTQALVRKLIELCYEQGRAKVLDEIIEAIPDLNSKRIVRLQIYRYKLENNLYDNTQESWFLERQIQLIENSIGKDLLNDEIESELVNFFIDNLIPRRPSSDLKMVTLDSIPKNSLAVVKRQLMYLPKERSETWYESVFSNLKRYIKSLSPEAQKNSIGIIAEVLEYVFEDVDMTIEIQKSGLFDFIGFILEKVLFLADELSPNGDKDRAKVLVNYYVRNINKLKAVIKDTLLQNILERQWDTVVFNLQKEYLQFFQERVMSLWNKIRGEGGLGFGKVGTALISQHTTELIDAYENDLLGDYAIKRNIEALFNRLGIGFPNVVESDKAKIQEITSKMSGDEPEYKKAQKYWKISQGVGFSIENADQTELINSLVKIFSKNQKVKALVEELISEDRIPNIPLTKEA